MALPGRGDGTDAARLHRRPGRGDRAGARTRASPGTAYTVWDGAPVGFDELFTRLAEAVGGKPPRKLPRPLLSAVAGAAELVAKARGVPPAFGRHGITLVDRRGTASNRSAREGLGWEPKVGLEEGIRRSAEWLAATRPLSSGA